MEVILKSPLEITKYITLHWLNQDFFILYILTKQYPTEQLRIEDKI